MQCPCPRAFARSPDPAPLRLPSRNPFAPPLRPARFHPPVETPLRISGHPARVLSWTRRQWEALGAMQPTDTMRLAGGVRILILVD